MIQSVKHRPLARTIAPRREAFLTLLKMKKRENFCFETLKSFGVNVADEHFPAPRTRVIPRPMPDAPAVAKTRWLIRHILSSVTDGESLARMSRRFRLIY